MNRARTQPLHRKLPNFDPVARIYRWAEYLCLGSLLTRTRNHFLPQLQQAHMALVLGDGDGRFLAHLLRRAPHLHALAVDTSAAMLRLLQARCAFAGARLVTRQASVTPLPPDLNLGNIDLIVTHFLLDCLIQGDLERLAQQLARTVPPGCLWVVSDFGIPHRHPWRFLARLYVRGLYLAFRVLTGLQTQTLPDIPGALARAGFLRMQRVGRLKGLLYSELWQLAPAKSAR